MSFDLLKERRAQVVRNNRGGVVALDCNKASAAGSVSQRACTFCGSGSCSIHRGRASSGARPVAARPTPGTSGAPCPRAELHRISCSTDMREREVVFGGEQRLEASCVGSSPSTRPRRFRLRNLHRGVIGDDVPAVCKRVEADVGIPVIPVLAEGFRAPSATLQRRLWRLADPDRHGDTTAVTPQSINLLGDFNVAGESWIIRKYFEEMGVEVVSVLTGDAASTRSARSRRPPERRAMCGSMTRSRKHAGTLRHSLHSRVFLRIEDTADALYRTAEHMNSPEIMEGLVPGQPRDLARVARAARLQAGSGGQARGAVRGRAFKAFSLVRALRQLGVSVVLAGTQTGSKEEYEELQACATNTRSSWTTPIRLSWRRFSSSRTSTSSSAA